MTEFLLEQLTAYVLDSGAAFILTNTAYLLASTMSHAYVGTVKNLDVLRTTTMGVMTDTEWSYLNSLWNIIQSLESGDNEFGLALYEDSGVQPRVGEALMTVDSHSYYVQVAILPTATKNVSFILVMYSSESAYNGNLSTAVVNSAVISVGVLLFSLVCILCITKVVLAPLNGLKRAMKQIDDDHHGQDGSPRHATILPRPSIKKNSISSTNEQTGFLHDNNKKQQRAVGREKLEPANSPSPSPSPSTPNTASTRQLLRTRSDRKTSSPSSFSRQLYTNSPLQSSPMTVSVRRLEQRDDTDDDERDQKTNVHGLAAPTPPLHVDPALQQAGQSPHTEVQRDAEEDDDDKYVHTTRQQTPISSKDIKTQLRSWCSTMIGQKLEIPVLWYDVIGDEPLPQYDALLSYSVGRSWYMRWFLACWIHVVRFLSEIVSMEKAFGWLLFRLYLSQQSWERESNKSKEFIRYIFHEVRVPLQALVLGAEDMMYMRQQRASRSSLLPDRTQQSAFPMSEEELLSSFESGTKTIQRILNDVLTHQRIEDGERPVEMREFVAQSLLQNTVREFQAMFVSKRLICQSSFTVEPNPSPKDAEHRLWTCRIISDAQLIKQVLSNLISNAIKFSFEGSTIFVDLTFQRDSTRLLCTVRDQGIGISSEEQQQLFQAYGQIRPADNQQGRGTGLGLSICRNLLHLLGGDISVESAMNQGSVFSFFVPVDLVMLAEDTPLVPPTPTSSPELPNQTRFDTRSQSQPVGMLSTVREHELEQDKDRDQKFEHSASTSMLAKQKPLSPVVTAPSSSNSSPSSSSTSSPKTIHNAPIITSNMSTLKLQKPRVLVVEDSLANRRLLARSLERLNAVVDVAENGQKGVDMVEHAIAHLQPYQAIFMDNTMPIMSGLEASRQIRQRLNLTVPIIGVTGNAQQVDRDEFIAAGATQVLPKPVNNDILKRVMAELFELQ